MDEFVTCMEQIMTRDVMMVMTFRKKSGLFNPKGKPYDIIIWHEYILEGQFISQHCKILQINLN